VGKRLEFMREFHGGDVSCLIYYICLDLIGLLL
jgi:hypothetical protein